MCLSNIIKNIMHQQQKNGSKSVSMVNLKYQLKLRSLFTRKSVYIITLLVRGTNFA